MIQNFSYEIEGQKARYSHLQNELKSKESMFALCVCGIILIGFVCIMLAIANLYYCVFKKAQKHRVQQRHSLVGTKKKLNAESQIKPQLKRHHALNNLNLPSKRVKGEGNQTILGRFEPESFSDAINNLPVVQEEVIDDIVEEMKTESDKNIDLEHVFKN